MVTPTEKLLLKLSLPHYIESKDDIRKLLNVAKIIANDNGTIQPKDYDFLVAINAIADICRPFNILRKELELATERMEAD